MKKPTYNITSYSTALFATWIFVEELNILIDAGDGLTSGLMQKARKVKNAFITHPDRDHLTGLMQFLQLNAREEYPIIHYPADSGSFPAMKTFFEKFDPHVQVVAWKGIKDQDEILIKKGISVQAIRNEHIIVPLGVHKSLSYKVYEERSKLKEEFSSLKGHEIKALVDKYGRDYIHTAIKRNVISFSGDTPVDDYSKWDNSEILMHECTFIPDKNGAVVSSHSDKHSNLDEVLRMVSEINVGILILHHFSTRYDHDYIIKSIKERATKYNIDIPIYTVLPGQINHNILQGQPVNA